MARADHEKLPGQSISTSRHREAQGKILPSHQDDTRQKVEYNLYPHLFTVRHLYIQ